MFNVNIDPFVTEANPYEGIIIKDDRMANWAIKKVKFEFSEADRLKALAKAEIEELKMRIEYIDQQCENNTRFLKSQLEAYFNTVERKESKTQESYKLLDGSLVYKKPSKDYEKDENALIEWAMKNNHEDVVETTKKLKWADFKKQLSIVGDTVVITETGEVVPDISVIEKDGKFEVK